MCRRASPGGRARRPRVSPLGVTSAALVPAFSGRGPAGYFPRSLLSGHAGAAVLAEHVAARGDWRLRVTWSLPRPALKFVNAAVDRCFQLLELLVEPLDLTPHRF